MKKHLQWLTNKFSWNRYAVACVFVFLYSLIQKVCPSVSAPFLYIYRFGYYNPWIVIYKNTDLGIVNLAQCMRASGYRGIEWIPQNIFLDAAILYVAVLLLAELVRWTGRCLFCRFHRKQF